MSRSPRKLGTDGFLNGRLLIAMPSLSGAPFEKSVVLLCHHTPETAMGIILNKPIATMSFDEVLRHLSIDGSEPASKIIVHSGGPVETSRGFVLHSDDYANKDGTLNVATGIALTATMDILKALATGHGPNRILFALGYAGWGAGQLEAELRENAWLVGEPDDSIVFDDDLDSKWLRALSRIGVDPARISDYAGRA